MLDFREITIEDKELFKKKLLESNIDASEYNFTNFFMWRVCYNFKFTQIMDALCVISVGKNSEPFAFMPIGKLTNEEFLEIASLLKEYFHSNNWSLKFKKIPENKLHYFSELVSLKEDVEFDRDNSDYVYLSEDLINLKGKKYDAKRNHIKKFINNNSYEFVEITQENINECYEVLAKWCEQKTCEKHGALYCEKKVNKELLNNFDKLECMGVMIKLAGKAEAFTIGEMLSHETAVVHIEKANVNIQGLYPFLNQQFCKRSLQMSKYVNREQDLGVEGLRKSKLSYNPYMMVNKYNVRIK